MSATELNTAADDRDQLYWLCDRLRRVRLPLEDEKALQAALAQRLVDYGLVFQREMPVEGGIIDFFVPSLGAGLEIKIKGTVAQVTRQLRGYAKDPRIEELILITAKPFNVPVELGRRRVFCTVVDISRGWL